MTPAYKETDGWKVAQPSDHLPRGPWWEIFGDPELHALAEEVRAANQNLKIAEARLREARAMVRFNRAALFPDDLGRRSAPAPSASPRNRPFLTPSVGPGQQRRSPPVARHVVRDRPVGPCPADGGGGPPGGPGDRRRSGDRPAQPAGRARDRLLRAAGRRRAAAAPGRDGEGVRGGAAPHDQSLPGRRRPEVRRRPGPDTARYHPGAGRPTSPCSGRSSSTRSRR